MVFADRVDAGAQLAGWSPSGDGTPSSSGLPVEASQSPPRSPSARPAPRRHRGPQARCPLQPELAMGAIGEDGARFLNRALIERGRISHVRRWSSVANGRRSMRGCRTCGAGSRGSTCATRWRSSSTTASRRAPLLGSPAGWPATSVLPGSCSPSRSWLPRRLASGGGTGRTRSSPSRRPGPSAPWAPTTGTSPRRPTTRSSACSDRPVSVRPPSWGPWGHRTAMRTRTSSFPPGS